MAVRFELIKEYAYHPGVRRNLIMCEGQDIVGGIALVDFVMEKPFLTEWTYLASLIIREPYRGQGLGRLAVRTVSDEILSRNAYGVLKNAIKLEKAKHLYRSQGWRQIEGIEKKWEFLMGRDLSGFYARKVVEVVRENFTK